MAKQKPYKDLIRLIIKPPKEVVKSPEEFIKELGNCRHKNLVPALASLDSNYYIEFFEQIDFSLKQLEEIKNHMAKFSRICEKRKGLKDYVEPYKLFDDYFHHRLAMERASKKPTN